MIKIPVLLFIIMLNAFAEENCDQQILSNEQQTFFSKKILLNPTPRSWKSWKELDTYRSCYHLKDYDLSPKDKRAIEIASKHYQIPFQLLTCLLFIESRYNPKAVSPSKAIGIAQMTKGTISTLKAVNSYPNIENLNACEKKALNKNEVSYCNALMERQFYAKKWDELSLKLKKEKLISGNKTPFNSGSSISSIAMSAMYMHYLLEMVKTHLEVEKVDSANALGFYKLALASYNSGPGTVSRKISKVGDHKSIEKYIVAVSDIPETAGHMKGIERCMRPHTYEAPSKAEERGKPCIP